MEEQLQCMEFTVTEDMEEERIDKLLRPSVKPAIR